MGTSKGARELNMSNCILICCGVLITNLITGSIVAGWWHKKVRALEKQIRTLCKLDDVWYDEPVMRYVSGANREQIEQVIHKLDPDAIVENAFETFHMFAVTSKLSNQLLSRLPYIHKVIAKENMIGVVNF